MRRGIMCWPLDPIRRGCRFEQRPACALARAQKTGMAPHPRKTKPSAERPDRAPWQPWPLLLLFGVLNRRGGGAHGRACECVPCEVRAPAKRGVVEHGATQAQALAHAAQASTLGQHGLKLAIWASVALC